MPFDDTTSPRGPTPGPDPAPTGGERAFCRALFAGYLLAGAAYAALWAVLAASLAAFPFLDGRWVTPAGYIALTTLVCAPICPSWRHLRVLGAGRWP